MTRLRLVATAVFFRIVPMWQSFLLFRCGNRFALLLFRCGNRSVLCVLYCLSLHSLNGTVVSSSACRNATAVVVLGSSCTVRFFFFSMAPHHGHSLCQPALLDLFFLSPWLGHHGHSLTSPPDLMVTTDNLVICVGLLPISQCGVKFLGQITKL